MRSAALVLLACLATSALSTATQASCLSAETDERVSGKLSMRQVDRRDVLILRLAVPVCLNGKERLDNVNSTLAIHIYSNVAGMARALKRLVGQPVLVRGRLFGAMSQHHKAPIVMEVVEIDPGAV